MNKAQITELINSKIIDNDNGQITAEVMRDVLNAINEGVGDGYIYIGIATPSTTPVTLTGDEKVFYIATEEGDYTNFGLGNISELSVIKSENGSWKGESLNIPFLNLEQLFSQSYTSHPYVLKNALVNIAPPNDTKFMRSQNWDLVFIKIYNDSLTLRIEGLIGTNNIIGYFTAPTLDNDSYIASVSTNKSVYDIPSGAKYAVIDIRKANNVDYSLLRVYQEGLPVSCAEVNLRLDQTEERINVLEENMTAISDYIEINDYEYKEGFFVTATGVLKANSSFNTNVYNISNLEYHKLYVSAGITSGSSLRFVSYFTSDDIYIGSEYYYNTSTVIKSAELHIPAEAGIIKVSTSRFYTAKLEKTVSEGIIDMKGLQDEIEAINNKLDVITPKLMKVVIRNDESFYIRTAYNSNQDIILSYYINKNLLLSPCATYVALNTFDDTAIMIDEYKICDCTDSTAPLFTSPIYWHLFAQHGYLIPYIPNNIGMTVNDVGAIWRDQLNREFTIGKVTDDYIYLLPRIYQDDNGNDTRDWKTSSSPKIQTMTHISGGVITSAFSVTNVYREQLRPIMTHARRVHIIDGKKVQAGTYYCDDFSVSESQIGYDPASIQDWFGSEDKPVLDGASEMARFTWSYNFKGAQCCANTTIEILKKVACASYGATQQQFFFDKEDYKAMFMLPKAAAVNGVELDKPFHSPNTEATGYVLYRTSSSLKDVNDPVDRMIGYLYNSQSDDYRFGMAAGLSLVSGDTIREKRIQNMAIGDASSNYRVASISPSNTNKFYVAAINTSNYADDDFHLPRGYFKEINYYVSYFDPNANKGQVYWYKDGNEYIIYAHCQEEIFRCEISLPSFMEGLSVKIVEKTNDTVLLTDKISNSKISVRYGSDAANYIVLKAI